MQSACKSTFTDNTAMPGSKLSVFHSYGNRYIPAMDMKPPQIVKKKTLAITLNKNLYLAFHKPLKKDCNDFTFSVPMSTSGFTPLKCNY